MKKQWKPFINIYQVLTLALIGALVIAAINIYGIHKRNVDKAKASTHDLSKESGWIMSTDGNHILWREDPSNPGHGWLYAIESNGDTVQRGAYGSGQSPIRTTRDTVKHPYRFPVFFHMIDSDLNSLKKS